MRRRQSYCWILAAAGLLLAGTCLLLTRKDTGLPDAVLIALGTIGALLFGGSLGTLFGHACTESDPVLRKRRTEENDERNTAIRSRAKALSGDILAWGLFAVAWIALNLEAPRWVFWLLFGSWVLKRSLDEVFRVWYQRKM